MSTISVVALSGMKAAMLRLGASANNIANARSNGALPGSANALAKPAYTPVQVAQSPLASGGVEARVITSSASLIATYDPTAFYANAQGMVAAPDVDLVNEMLELATAKYSFAANLKVAQTGAEMLDALLGIKA